MRRLMAILTTALAVTGCESNEALSPQFNRVRAGSPGLNVVSYNVYWGAHVEDLLTADPLQIPMIAAGLGNRRANRVCQRSCRWFAGGRTLPFRGGERFRGR